MTAKLLPAGYRAALEGAAWFIVPQAGCLLIHGRDRSSFLQRQTTNDIRRLEVSHALPTILTSPNARILDVLYLLADREESITALTLPGFSAVTAAYFKKRIFFMDQVEVEDVSPNFAQIDLIGPCRADITSLLGFSSQPEPDKPLTMLWKGDQIHLLHNSAALWPGWRLLIPVGLVPDLVSVLEGAGFESVSQNIYHLLHLENGIPQAQSELNENYTPLEAGLQVAISDSKGCYTGQEIIARQITYDKITQHLCGLRLSSYPASGSQIWHENQSIGEVTSMAISPRFGPIALAVIKRPYHEPGTIVHIGSGLEHTQEIIVSRLPFEFE